MDEDEEEVKKKWVKEEDDEEEEEMQWYLSVFCPHLVCLTVPRVQSPVGARQNDSWKRAFSTETHGVGQSCQGWNDCLDACEVFGKKGAHSGAGIGSSAASLRRTGKTLWQRKDICHFLKPGAPYYCSTFLRQLWPAVKYTVI